MEEEGRRAAHVKWDGKTIALGTFSVAEAVEKCERAKALTKKWRASMVPKPDVEWVKKALERLNIRVVNDRPGRRRKEEIQEKLRRKSNTGITNTIGGSLPLSLQNVPSTQNASGKRSPPTEYSKVFPSESYPGDRLSKERIIGSFDIHGSTDSIRALGSGFSGGRNFDTTFYMKGEYNPTDVTSALPIRQGNQAHSYDVATSCPGRSNPPGLDSAAESRRHYEILKEHHANLLRELQQTTDLMQMYQNNYEQIEQESLDATNSPAYSSAPTPMMIHTAPQNSSSTSFRQAPQVSSNQQMYYPYDYNTEGRGPFTTAYHPASQRSSFDKAYQVGSQTHDHNINSRGISHYKTPLSNENSFKHNVMHSSRPTLDMCDPYKRLKYGSFSEQEPSTDLNFEHK